MILFDSPHPDPDVVFNPHPLTQSTPERLPSHQHTYIQHIHSMHITAAALKQYGCFRLQKSATAKRNRRRHNGGKANTERTHERQQEMNRGTARKKRHRHPDVINTRSDPLPAGDAIALPSWFVVEHNDADLSRVDRFPR